MAPGQLGCDRQETLPLPEPVGAFLTFERGGAADAGGVPTGSDLGSGSRTVLAAQQDEASGLYGLLVETGRDEEIETDRRAKVEFALGHRAGKHGRIGKQQAAATVEQAGPLG